MFRKYLFVFILLILYGCQQEKYDWNPIFEDTHFDFFKTDLERSLALIDEAYSEANKHQEKYIIEKLYHAKSRLLEIKDYYLPLTMVRQKIFDAERFFKLNNSKGSEKLLKETKSIIISLDLTTKNKVFDKVILKLNAMVDEVIVSLNETSKPNTFKKMKALGEHVNLMLYRGDLVLSGIEFEK